jgi:hypothetical protein
MYFGFWPFFVLYILKFEIKIQKVPTLNGIPGSAPASRELRVEIQNCLVEREKA